MKQKLLSQQDIEEARRLRREKKLGKRRLAMMFHVSSTTIWENVYNVNYKRPKRIKKAIVVEISTGPKVRCTKCEKLITRNVEGNRIPVNFQIQDNCITCYLRSVGLTYMDLLE